MYGESEFWFCSIKVITIIGLIITGIIITAGGGPNHQSIGFRFWNETGGFVQYEGIAGAKGRFLGFFSGSSNMTGELLGLMVTVLISAAFAFIGTEITAIAAAETANVCQRFVWKGISLIRFEHAASPKRAYCYQERLDQTSLVSVHNQRVGSY